MQRIIPLLLMFALAPAAHAQAMFRSVMPDGKIVYSDKPAPGAKESKQVNLKPLNIVAPVAGTPAPGDVPPLPGNSNANNAEIASARQNLEAAQKALDAGREQRDGDRVGIARPGGAGGSRPSDEYLQRVKSLEDAVTTAQTQLDAAQRSAGR
ncbi:MAG: DUF4124 domain-containing protein [Burkholderiales bacterium]